MEPDRSSHLRAPIFTETSGLKRSSASPRCLAKLAEWPQSREWSNQSHAAALLLTENLCSSLSRLKVWREDRPHGARARLRDRSGIKRAFRAKANSGRKSSGSHSGSTRKLDCPRRHALRELTAIQ
jgi:hypothetical protein